MQKAGEGGIDTHVHPFDVLGFRRPEAHSSDHIPGPNLIEKMRHHPVSWLALKILARHTPQYIRNSALGSFGPSGEQRLCRELFDAGLSSATLVPIEPYVSAQDIQRHFPSENFFHIGSIPIHDISIEHLERYIEDQITRCNICGIKLHPNIQRFFPQPSWNNRAIAEKLELIYQIAERKKLYLLFHSGKSYILPPTMESKRDPYAGTYGVLQNYLGRYGKESEVFRHRIPIVLAHLGHFHELYQDTSLLRLIREKYEHVYFDTSGVGPSVLIPSMRAIGPEAILFGSDAHYFRIKHHAHMVFRAIVQSFPHGEVESNILKIFRHNYIQHVISQQ